MEAKVHPPKRTNGRRWAVGAILLLLAADRACCQITYTPYDITTIAGSPGVGGSKDGTNGGALFKEPAGIVADSSGNLYVADTFNQVIRKIAPVGSNWVVTTIAGQVPIRGGAGGNTDGTNTGAQF